MTFALANGIGGIEMYAPCPPEMVDQCYAIRREIYCVKLGWESDASDEQDAWSHHVLVHEYGLPVATTRITPLPNNPRVAELGRTAMLDICEDRFEVLGQLADGLRRLFRQLEVEYCLAFMEKRMVRLERRYGFVWEGFGPVVQHNGARRWYCMRVAR